MNVPFVSFKPLEKELDTQLRAAFDRVLTSSWYIGGKEVPFTYQNGKFNISGQTLANGVHDIRFEIIKRGFIVTIWSKEADEDGICMYCYDSRPETGNWTCGWNRNIRDPYLSRAKAHVEKLIKEARDEAQKENL